VKDPIKGSTISTTNTVIQKANVYVVNKAGAQAVCTTLEAKCIDQGITAGTITPVASGETDSQGQVTFTVPATSGDPEGGYVIKKNDDADASTVSGGIKIYQTKPHEFAVAATDCLAGTTIHKQIRVIVTVNQGSTTGEVQESRQQMIA